ncbi:MAG: germination protein YpeB [Clostridiales bacterium]|nr:germination protein YpeB [Clostridiales bacterium]
MTITRRGFIRLCSYTVAIVGVLAIRNVQLMFENDDKTIALENSYVRAIEDLSTSAENISTTLQKGIYSGTPEMLQELSAKLWRESGSAKAALAQLPVQELQLENTNKFLSQVGNYALSISQKVSDGETLSNEEYKNLKSLYHFSKNFSQEMWDLESQINSGQISIVKIANAVQASAGESAPPTVTEGFSDFEEGFESYPTLIYDGPFSDHILEKDPIMIKGAEDATEDYALKRGAQAANVNQSDLKRGQDEAGKMPSYVFENENTSVAITKQGGLISYMLKSREVSSNSVSQTEAMITALRYLESLGIKNMQTTYYETYNNIITINYAARQDDIVCYTDLIKVSVALDNGEILGFDARGYIVNHFDRTFTTTRMAESDAKALLSPLLTVTKSKLALIPTEGTNEVLCYEFTCTTDEDTKVLVYIGVESKKEEQILILYESETGVLTM